MTTGRTGPVRLRGLWRRYFTDRWSCACVAPAAPGPIASEITEESDDGGPSVPAAATRRSLTARARLRPAAQRHARDPRRASERTAGRARVARRCATDDVLRVADGLARQAAYSGVFARPDRRFWADVLAPVTARRTSRRSRPTTSPRSCRRTSATAYEGWQVDGGCGSTYEHVDAGTRRRQRDLAVRAELGATWSHNLSLDHQFARGRSEVQPPERRTLTDDVRPHRLSMRRRALSWSISGSWPIVACGRRRWIRAVDYHEKTSLRPANVDLPRLLDATLDRPSASTSRTGSRCGRPFPVVSAERSRTIALQINRRTSPTPSSCVYDLDRTLN